MSEIAIVQATFPDANAANDIGRRVVEERLATCVNVLGPCRSTFRWQGDVETDDEVIAQFKTLPDRAEALAARIAEFHPYELPVIERWTATVDQAVHDWVHAALTA